MRRDAFRERLVFLLVLAGVLLLLSVLMLRHEPTALSTRTFRDGFIVAKDVMRRTEIVATATTNGMSGSSTRKTPFTEDMMLSHASGLRTTTVKTEDGDEITIKRPVMNQSSKITTIFRDEKGTLTIEETAAKARERKDADGFAEKKREKSTIPSELYSSEDAPTSDVTRQLET